MQSAVPFRPIPIKSKRDAREEAQSCNSISEIQSMSQAIATEREMLIRYRNAATLCGTFAERWLSRRIANRRGPLLDYFQDVLVRRYRELLSDRFPPGKSQ